MNKSILMLRATRDPFISGTSSVRHCFIHGGGFCTLLTYELDALGANSLAVDFYPFYIHPY